MKKTIAKLIIAVDSKPNAVKRSSRTITNFINKIPCSKDQLNKPSIASLFIQDQMRDYPNPPKSSISSRTILLGEKIKIQMNKNKKAFNEILSKLQQKFTFLQLEEAREIIKKMNHKQVQENKFSLRKLKSIVNYYLESNQKNGKIERHLLESAEALIKEIRQAQRRKAHQVV